MYYVLTTTVLVYLENLNASKLSDHQHLQGGILSSETLGWEHLLQLYLALSEL